MTLIKIPNGILTIADESEPFFYRKKLFAVDEQWGPYLCDKFGDPTNKPCSEKMLQGAYEHWLKSR